jgi:hypothetical protein
MNKLQSSASFCSRLLWSPAALCVSSRSGVSPCKDHKVDLDLGSISFLSFSFWRPRDGDAGAVSKSARDFYIHGPSPGMANLTRIEASFPPCSVST